MDEIVTPQEARIETLLQILAVLLDKLGGEIVIGRKEFEQFAGAPVVGRYISKDYVMFRLAYEDEAAYIDAMDLPPNPQT